MYQFSSDANAPYLYEGIEAGALGRAFRKQRLKCSLSQSDVGTAMDVTQAMVSRFELHGEPISADRLRSVLPMMDCESFGDLMKKAHESPDKRKRAPRKSEMNGVAHDPHPLMNGVAHDPHPFENGHMDAFPEISSLDEWRQRIDAEQRIREKNHISWLDEILDPKMKKAGMDTQPLQARDSDKSQER